MSHPKRRYFRAPAATAVAALTAALLVPFGVLTAAPAAAAVGECPPGFLPGPGNQGVLESWTDNDVAVFAGGDFLADGGAAEAEGLLVVMGDATFDKAGGGHFNVGWVGVGSQTAPTPGGVMLAVGGRLTVGGSTTLDVGSGARDANGVLLGGRVQVGGAASPIYPSTQYELNHGALETGMGGSAVSQWVSFGAQLATNSASWVALSSTNPVSIAGPQLTFTGDGTTAMQTFTIDAAQLNGIAEVYFANVPDDAPVVINVVGNADVTFSPTYFASEGVRADDFASPLFGVVSQRTMWNFADATNIFIGGQSQFLGSIVAPRANLEISTQTNGRVYAGGDIHDFGAGNEFHNYPWIGPEYGCLATAAEPHQGVVQLTKVLATDGVVAQDRAFFGWLRCVGDSFEGEVLYREGFVRGGKTIPGRNLPVGADCELFEDPDRAVQGVDQQPLPTGFKWAAPRWMVNGQAVLTPTFVVPSEDEPAVEVTVTNMLLAQFSVEKVVAGPEGGYVGGRTFEISYVCNSEAFGESGMPLGTGSAEGTIAVLAASTELSPWFPVGTECNISERTPANQPGDFRPGSGFQWGESVVTHESLTIGAGDASPVAVTVTNAFAADGASSDSPAAPGDEGDANVGMPQRGGMALAVTGGDVPVWWAAVGGGLVAVGLGTVVVMLVRRRRG